MTQEQIEETFAKVWGNEVTCRLYLKGLEKRGVVFSIPIDQLTHDQCVEAAIQIYMDLIKREREAP